MFAKISWLCLFIAVGLLVWGGLCMVWSGDSRQDGDVLIVAGREQDLGEQTVGDHAFELDLRNSSSQPIHFVGMTPT
ncbi:MAG: hypothetical protein ACYC3I_18550 [Gemmataceae bacterium]